MYEAITFGISIIAQRNLTGQDTSKGTESIIQGFVVDTLVQVLDVNIADTRLTEGGIALRPHDTTWPTLDGIEIHGVQASFRYNKNTNLEFSFSYNFYTTTRIFHTNCSNSVSLQRIKAARNTDSYRGLKIDIKSEGTYHRLAAENSHKRIPRIFELQDLDTLGWKEQIRQC